MRLIIGLVLAILPTIWLVRYFVKSDKFPEPAGMIKKTFGLGVAIVFPVLAIALPLLTLIERIDNVYLNAFSTAFFTAAIPEEFLKFCVLYYFCSKHKEFNEPMDGVVYGATVSLGFAALENILYVAQGGIGVAVLRAFTAVPAHAAFGGIMGYLFARAHFGSHRPGFFHKALWVPVLLHGLYDFFLFAVAGIAGAEQELTGTSALIILALFAMFFFTFGLSLFLVRKHLKEIRAEQVLM